MGNPQNTENPVEEPKTQQEKQQKENIYDWVLSLKSLEEEALQQKKAEGYSFFQLTLVSKKGHARPIGAMVYSGDPGELLDWLITAFSKKENKRLIPLFRAAFDYIDSTTKNPRREIAELLLDSFTWFLKNEKSEKEPEPKENPTPEPVETPQP